MNIFLHLLRIIGLWLLCWPVYRRSLHMYQLCSYQNFSYRKYLRENKPETYSAKRIVPAVLGGACMLLPFGWSAAGIFVCALLMIVINKPGPAKKKLSFTHRAIRLSCCDMVITGAVFALVSITGVFGMMPIPSAVFGLLLVPALVIFQPFLIMPSAAVMSPLEKAISNYYINDARKILKSQKGMKIVGITGSYGKTSTKEFLGALLSAKYNVYTTPGNFNTTLGVTRAVREGLKPVHDLFVCEMGARHVNDIKEICDLVEPDIGVITSVGPQHLQTFGSLDRVLSTKLELYDAVKDKGTAFINMDSAPLASSGIKDGFLSYGTGDGRDYTASDIRGGMDGITFKVTTPSGESQIFHTRLLGDNNVLNITAAIAVSHYLGIPLKTLVPRVAALKGVPHRLQLIPGGDMTVIDDAYNSNTEGAKMALRTLKMFHGTRILVTPGLVELGDREFELNKDLGAYAADCCDMACLIVPRRAVPIKEGLIEAGFPEDKITVWETLEDAMKMIRPMAGQKTVLLLNDLTDQY